MPKKKKLTTFLLSVAIITAFLVTGCSNKSKDTYSSTDTVKDTETNKKQREALFKHVGLNMDNYKISHEKTVNGNLEQWWYKDTNNSSSCIYVASGNIKENDNKVFAEFSDISQDISGNNDYILEIALGEITDDGYLDMDKEVRDYYFTQNGEDISLIKTDVKRQ